MIWLSLCLYGPVSSAEVPPTDTGLMHDQDQSLRQGVDAGDVIHWGYSVCSLPHIYPLYLGSLYFRFEVHVRIPCSRYQEAFTATVYFLLNRLLTRDVVTRE